MSKVQESLCFEYVHKAYQFGFPTTAIQIDLQQTGYISPDISLDQFEEHFSDDLFSVGRRTYIRRAAQTAPRFVHYASRLTTKPQQIYGLGVARGFSNLISADNIERCMNVHKTTMAILQRGRSEDLTFDAANSNRIRPDQEWEGAVAEAYRLGYTAHEIDYFSMKWYPDTRRDGVPRGFASNYARIVEIILAHSSLDQYTRTNLDWQTDQAARDYVLAAFKIGIAVPDIMVQLYIHGCRIYEVTEKLLVKFLKEMDVIPS